MHISIFGLGYVGCVSLGCLAKLNYRVTGVETNKKKIDLISKGKPTISEPGLDKLIKYGFDRGLISATYDYKSAIVNTDLSFVCIGTPGNKNGNLNLNYLFNGLKQIAEGLKYKKSFHTIVIRSTVIPGSFNKIINILEKQSGKKQIQDFCVVMNPEFLREGSAVQDFLTPPFNIIGTGCDKGYKLLRKIYSFNKAPVERVSEQVAEMIKPVCNSFHGLKISFANEVGNLCKKIGIDSNEIMRIFCEDKKLNISSAYLKPGFAFGGSCLPKDIKAISRLAGDLKVKVPVIVSIKSSNDLQKRKAFELIKGFGIKKISIWGLSFKIGTDDLRGSPIIEVINMLGKEGYDVKAFDQNVHLDKIIGSNREYIQKNIPAINKIIVKDFKALIKHSKLLVVNSYDKKLIGEIKRNEDLIILDLVDIAGLKKIKSYTGLCW